MKGFFIALLALIGRIAALVTIGYFFFIYAKAKWIDNSELVFLVENKQFVIYSGIIIGVGSLLSLVDALRKLFSIRFLKGLILLLITAAFVAAYWFMFNNIPF